MFDCTHDCSSCSESRGEHTAPQGFRAPANGLSHIGKVIAMISDKGGVSKSLVTSSLAVAMRRMGKTVDVLDADITDSSIPTAFSVHTKAEGSELGIYPTETKTGIGIMSLSLLTESETDPMIWRGPMTTGAVKRFWTDIIWGDADYLLVSMLPRAGDVPLTMFQPLPVGGVVMVATPQDPMGTTVAEAVKMTEMMYIPVLGLVENYSCFCCPDYDKGYAIFDENHIERVTAALGLKVLARLPIDPVVAAAYDAGRIEELEPNYLTAMAELLAK